MMDGRMNPFTPRTVIMFSCWLCAVNLKAVTPEIEAAKDHGAKGQVTLSTMCPILKTSKDAKEVQQRMTQAGFTFFDEKASEAFLTHKTDSIELEQRVEKLKQNKP